LCILFDSEACRDPDAGGHSYLDRHRKYLILGAYDDSSKGLGNLLAAYPAAYFYAVLTNRDIIIVDKSMIGDMCAVIECGFPFMNEMNIAYPNIINDKNVYSSEILHANQFYSSLTSHDIMSKTIVRESGYTLKSDWWASNKTLAECISRVTGCFIGDIMCGERYSLKKLIRGPFMSNYSDIAQKYLLGAPLSFKHALASLPQSHAPRIDVSIHLRNQFHHFENEVDVNDPAYVKEVTEFLTGSDCTIVFQNMVMELVQKLKEIRETTSHNNGGGLTISATDPERQMHVYIAADNQQVKEAFVQHLARSEELTPFNPFLMRFNSTKIVHIKDTIKFKDDTHISLVNIVFDWYAMSLSDNILAWRRAFTAGISSFVFTAQKLSGSADRSDAGGVGTKGYQLLRNRHGHVRFEMFWSYTIFNDYER